MTPHRTGHLHETRGYPGHDYTPAKKRKTGSGSAKNSKAFKSTTCVNKHYTSHCTELTVHFILEFTPDALQKWLNTPSNDTSMTRP